MPILVDASEPFDVAGRRFTQRDDLTGIPERLMQTWYVRRSFRVVNEETGAEHAEWAVVKISGRLVRNPRSRQDEETTDGRQAAVALYMFITNSGALTHLDELASDEGWWRVPVRDRRDTLQVIGDPYLAQNHNRHHYEALVRRSDG